MFVNNLRIFLLNKILLITLDQVQLKSVHATFHTDRTKSQVRVRKSRFFSFCDFAKKLSKQISIQEICGYKVFECTTYGLGVIGKNVLT